MLVNPNLTIIFNTIFVSSHMYQENPEVIVGSLNMGYISDTAKNRQLELIPMLKNISDSQPEFNISRASSHQSVPEYQNSIDEMLNQVKTCKKVNKITL